MPDGIDLSVHQPKAPALEAALDGAPRKAERDQLPLCNDSMLPLGKGHDLPLPSDSVAPPVQTCLTLTTHTGG